MLQTHAGDLKPFALCCQGNPSVPRYDDCSPADLCGGRHMNGIEAAERMLVREIARSSHRRFRYVDVVHSKEALIERLPRKKGAPAR